MKFDDGLPTGPNYVLGVLDSSEDNIPTRDRQFPTLESSISEVSSLSGWPFYSPGENTKASGLSLSVSQDSLYESKNNVVDYDELVEEIENEKNTNKPEHHKIMPEIQYDAKTEYPDNIKIDNLVDIPEADLDSVISGSKELADEIAKLLLDEGATSLLSFDSASSYVEAALTDGLGVNGKIDATIPSALSNILRLSVICRYVDKSSIPDKYKNIFLSNLTRLLSNDSFDEMKKKEKSDKHSALLKATALQGRVIRNKQNDSSTTHVQQREEQHSPIGVGQGGSGLRVRQQFKE